MAKIDLRGELKVLAAAMRSDKEAAGHIDLKALGKELVAKEKLTAKQYELIQAMDEEQQGMVKTLLDAMLTKAAEEEEPEETPEAMAAKAEAAKQAAAAQQSQVANADLGKKLEGFMTTVTDSL